MGDTKPSKDVSESKVAGNTGCVARILTWNINGLRKVAKSHGGLKALLGQFDADIVEQGMAQAEGYHCLFTHCEVHKKSSYSGVATFIRSESGLKTLASTTSLGDSVFFGSPGSVAGGLSPDRLRAIDSEGRVLVTDHGHFVLLNVYAPYTSSIDDYEKAEERRMFKRDFLGMLEARISEVRESGRGVILVGDLNSCATQLDYGFTINDADFLASSWSKWIRGVLGLDSSDPPRLVDCFRRLHPERKKAFTCWNTKTGARENNYGTRIDYIIASVAFADRYLVACDIMPDFFGSDHCPVRATFVIPFSPVLQGPALDGNRSGVCESSSMEIGHAYQWPEHPPECSCFFSELTAKQEKLATYFAIRGTKKASLTVKRAQGNAVVKKGKARDNQRMSTLFCVDGRKGVGSQNTPSLQATASSNRAERHGAQSNNMKVVGRKSIRNTSAVGVSSNTARQSKLNFGATGDLSVRKGDSEVTSAGSVLDTTKPTIGTGRGTTMDPDDKRGSFEEVSATPLMLQPSGSENESSQDNEKIRIGGAYPIEGLENRGSSSSSTSTSSSNNTTKGDSSSEAWKAIFGQKKATPPCQHGERSIQRTVLKPGPNYNRRFYTCARSAGDWPVDRNAHCNFFQWRMDGVRGYKDRPSRDEDAKKQRRR